MSKYTAMLRFPIEQRLDDLGLSHTEDNWPRVYGIIGLDDYPVYDEAHRSVLNGKIIRRYYMREIGFETLGQFAWNMRRKMHEIMPYYNELFESETLVTDPMLSKSLDYTERWTRDEATSRNKSDARSTDTASTSRSTSDDRNVFQDTPMNGLDAGAIEAMDYATSVTLDRGTTENGASTKNETSGSSADGYTGDFDGTGARSQRGYDTSQSELLLTYRKTLLNIDLEIVDSLSTLFMGLW